MAENTRPRLLTPEEAGCYLGGDDKPIKPNTLRRWRWKGVGPAYHKIQGVIRYTPEDLDAEIEASRRRSTSEPVGAEA